MLSTAQHTLESASGAFEPLSPSWGDGHAKFHLPRCLAAVSPRKRRKSSVAAAEEACGQARKGEPGRLREEAQRRFEGSHSQPRGGQYLAGAPGVAKCGDMRRRIARNN
jgi:hypothetical protein